MANRTRRSNFKQIEAVLPNEIDDIRLSVSQTPNLKLSWIER